MAAVFVVADVADVADVAADTAVLLQYWSQGIAEELPCRLGPVVVFEVMLTDSAVVLPKADGRGDS